MKAYQSSQNSYTASQKELTYFFLKGETEREREKEYWVGSSTRPQNKIYFIKRTVTPDC